MSSKKTSQHQLSIDSLLDTLFNVVGMLIIILIAVHLNAIDVINVLKKEQKQIDQSEVDTARKEAEELKLKLKEKQASLERILNIIENEKNFEKEIGRLEIKKRQVLNNITTLKIRLETKQKQNRNVIILNAEKDKLISQIKMVENKISKKEQILATLLSKKIDPNLELRVPVVRSVQNDMDAVIFFCKNKKIYSFKSSIINEVLGKAIDHCKTEVCLESFINKNDQGDEHIRIKIDKSHRDVTHYYIAIIPRVNAGWETDDIGKTDSAYISMIKKLNNQKHAIVFLVWHDSYNEYLAARGIVENLNFKAGWEPYDKEDTFRIQIYPPPSGSSGGSGGIQIDN